MTQDTELDGSKAMQLGSLSWDVGIDQEIGKKTNSQPLEMTPVKHEGKVSFHR